MEIESRLLAEVYEPMWYHYDAEMVGHEDIAVFALNLDERVELLDSAADPECKDGRRGEMSQMVAEFGSNHEFYRIGIKQRQPGEEYRIGIDCPNQWGQKHSIYQALIEGDTYRDITMAVETLAEIVRGICDKDAEPQWLKL